MPLWDLVYLLGDAFVHLDGETAATCSHARVDLFGGRSPHSPTLFRGWASPSAAGASR